MTNVQTLSPESPEDAPGVRLELLQYAETKLAEALATRAVLAAENSGPRGRDAIREIAALTLSLARMTKLLEHAQARLRPRAAQRDADREPLFAPDDGWIDDIPLEDPHDPLNGLTLDAGDARPEVSAPLRKPAVPDIGQSANPPACAPDREVAGTGAAAEGGATHARKDPNSRPPRTRDGRLLHPEPHAAGADPRHVQPSGVTGPAPPGG